MDKTQPKIDLQTLQEQLSDCVGYINQAVDCIGNMWLILDGRNDECVRHREMFIGENGQVTFEEE